MRVRSVTAALYKKKKTKKQKVPIRFLQKGRREGKRRGFAWEEKKNKG